MEKFIQCVVHVLINIRVVHLSILILYLFHWRTIWNVLSLKKTLSYKPDLTIKVFSCIFNKTKKKLRKTNLWKEYERWNSKFIHRTNVSQLRLTSFRYKWSKHRKTFWLLNILHYCGSYYNYTIVRVWFLAY